MSSLARLYRNSLAEVPGMITVQPLAEKEYFF
jgi:hypothetical protein